MNLLPEVRDCLGCSHNSNRNSHFDSLWRVIGQADYAIREFLTE